MVSHKDYSAELHDAYPDLGHPIADPQPGFVVGTTKFLPRAALGDVGYIQHNGRFIRLFNVHKPPGTDGQPSIDRLPAGFEVLDRAAVEVQEGQLNKNLFKSKSIIQLSADAGASGPAASLIPLPLQGTFNFKSTRQRGAILVTPGPDRTTTLDASPRGVKLYKAYAAKHMLSWMTFFEDEGLNWGDLMLVTGVDLTASWATAVFKSSSADLGLGLDVSYITVGGIRAAATLSWSHDEVAMTNSTPLTQDGPNVEQNQAIFIRRLRAKRGILGLSIRANAEPRDIDMGHDPDIGSDPSVGVKDESKSYVKLEDDVKVKMEDGTQGDMEMEEDSGSDVKMEEDVKPYMKIEEDIKPNMKVEDGVKTESSGDIRPDDVEMEEEPERGEFVDALSPALDYILENSNAQVALVHDSDLPTYKRFATGWLSKGVVVTDNGIGMFEDLDHEDLNLSHMSHTESAVHAQQLLGTYEAYQQQQHSHSIYPTSSSPDTATSPTSPGLESAAHKARLLFKKTMTREEAELDAKKIASDSRLSIAEGTPRLFTLPYDELRLVQSSGKATSGRFTVTNGIIKLDDAGDGDADRVPSPEQCRRKVDAAGRVDQYVQLAESQTVYTYWMKTVGRLVAYHMFHQKRTNSVRFRIQLPHGYTLWHHVDGTVSDEENARKDPYLYGSKTHGTGKTPFRSPAEFAPHFMWLMLGRPEGECKCQYCTHRPQDEVSAELFGYLSKSEIQRLQPVASGSRQPVASGSRQQSAVEKKKPRGRRPKPIDKPIVAKDYTTGLY